MQVGALKEDVGNDGKHGQRDALLYYLELNEVERTAVLDEAHAVGGHLAAILEESDAPGENNHADEGPVAADTRLL